MGGGFECSGTGSSQGQEGHGGEGFLSDSFVDVASLSQAGSERRVSHDAGVDAELEGFPFQKNSQTRENIYATRHMESHWRHRVLGCLATAGKNIAQNRNFADFLR